MRTSHLKSDIIFNFWRKKHETPHLKSRLQLGESRLQLGESRLQFEIKNDKKVIKCYFFNLRMNKYSVKLTDELKLTIFN